MSELSPKRKRTLALHERALRFTLIKIRMGSLDHHQITADRALESEAGQLASIYAAIIRNMRLRLEREAEERKQRRKKPTGN